MKKFVLITLFCLGLGWSSYGSEPLIFANQQIAQLFSNLNEQSEELLDDTTHTCRYTIDTLGYRVVAIIDSSRVLTHLGLDIFGEEIKEFQERTILDFVERYMLELLLEGGEKSQNIMTKVDDVTLSAGLSSLPILVGSSEISLNLKNENRRCAVEWGNGKSSFSISFPLDYGFISGYTKIELENNFTSRLKNYNYCYSQPDFTSKRVTKIADNLYSYSLSDSTFNKMPSIQYLEKKGQEYSYIAGGEHLIESFINLVTAPAIESDIWVNITQRKYSFQTEKFRVKLQNLVALSQEQGCVPYVSVETADDKAFEATLILVNRELNYNHLFYFKADNKTLSTLKGDISAEISTFIPTHNLESLFDDKNQTNSKHKIKL